MSTIRVGVCELHPEMKPGSEAWNAFAEKARDARLDLLLLNEMPFGPWIAARPSFDREVWRESCRAHQEGIARLGELGAAAILGSRPVELEGRRVNQAFVRIGEGGVEGVHTKHYFPDEEGYYEARWFEAGESHFRVAEAAGARVGFLICTEVMFNEHARRYGRDGAQIVAVPRAVGKGTLRRWRVALRMAAIVSGCYVISSNRSGVDSRGQKFGGCGWVIDPAGDVVAQTSSSTPLAWYDVELDFVSRAQREYPCYVRELEPSDR